MLFRGCEGAVSVVLGDKVPGRSRFVRAGILEVVEFWDNQSSRKDKIPGGQNSVRASDCSVKVKVRWSYSVGIGFVFVGDCPYICVIYILAVVCRLVIVANKKKLKTYDIQQKHSDCAYGSARGDGLLRTGKGHRLFPEQGSGSA